MNEYVNRKDLRDVEVINIDGNIVSNMHMAKVIRDKLKIIAERLGC